MAKPIQKIELYRAIGDSLVVDRNLEIKVIGTTKSGAYLEVVAGRSVKVDAKPKRTLLQILWQFLFKRRRR